MFHSTARVQRLMAEWEKDHPLFSEPLASETTAPKEDGDSAGTEDERTVEDEEAVEDEDIGDDSDTGDADVTLGSAANDVDAECITLGTSSDSGSPTRVLSPGNRSAWDKPPTPFFVDPELVLELSNSTASTVVQDVFISADPLSPGNYSCLGFSL